jgi:hypothetical protein
MQEVRNPYVITQEPRLVDEAEEEERRRAAWRKFKRDLQRLYGDNPAEDEDDSDMYAEPLPFAATIEQLAPSEDELLARLRYENERYFKSIETRRSGIRLVRNEDFYMRPGFTHTAAQDDLPQGDVFAVLPPQLGSMAEGHTGAAVEPPQYFDANAHHLMQIQDSAAQLLAAADAVAAASAHTGTEVGGQWPALPGTHVGALPPQSSAGHHAAVAHVDLATRMARTLPPLQHTGGLLNPGVRPYPGVMQSQSLSSHRPSITLVAMGALPVMNSAHPVESLPSPLRSSLPCGGSGEMLNPLNSQADPTPNTAGPGSIGPPAASSVSTVTSLIASTGFGMVMHSASDDQARTPVEKLTRPLHISTGFEVIAGGGSVASQPSSGAKLSIGSLLN